MPDYRVAATRAAQQYNINPQIFLALINQESGFNPNAKSPAGAQGIAQFMPATAKAYGVKLGDGRAADDLRGAARYLADSLKRTGGDYKAALSIYNSGRPDAYKDPNFAGGQTYNYVRSILGAAGGQHVPSVQNAPAGGGVVSTTTPGVDNSQARTGLIAQYLSDQHKPDALLALAAGLLGAKDTPAQTVTSPMQTVAHATSPGAAASAPTAKGVARFEGKPVAAWIAPVLQYARSQGWKGQINSGFRSLADQTRIYNSGVRPAAKPGTSNHEFTAFPGGAVDVSDAAALSKILQGSKYAQLLVWAGSKDPVHFSHPHNGSY